MTEEWAGTLVERVAIERFVDDRDDAGASVGQWQGAGAAWAAIVPDGRGGAEGEARRTRPRWRVTMRAPVGGSAVGLTSRLVWRGQWLAVLAVETDPRRPDRVTLRCEARAG
jgi:head-tail adaptor